MYGPPAHPKENPNTGGLVAALLGVVALTGGAVWYMRREAKKAEEKAKECVPLGGPAYDDEFTLSVAIKDADGNNACAGPGGIAVWEAGTVLTAADAPDTVKMKMSGTEYLVLFRVVEVDDSTYEATVSMGYEDVAPWVPDTTQTFTGTWGEWTHLEFPQGVQLAVQADAPAQ